MKTTHIAQITLPTTHRRQSPLDHRISMIQSPQPLQYLLKPTHFSRNKQTLRDLKPGTYAQILCDLYSDLFPPGEPDQSAREACSNFAKKPRLPRREQASVVCGLAGERLATASRVMWSPAPACAYDQLTETREITLYRWSHLGRAARHLQSDNIEFIMKRLREPVDNIG